MMVVHPRHANRLSCVRVKDKDMGKSHSHYVA